MASRALKLAFSGITGLFILGTSTVVWCGQLSLCTFGTYDAEIVVTNLTEREPLRNSRIRAYVNGNHILFPVGETYYTETNEEGRAKISFENAATAPLYINVDSPENEASIEFFVYPKDIRKGEEFTVVETEKFATGVRERDRIELKIEVNNWSMRPD